MNVTTETRSGKVYITHTMSDWSEPVLRTLFYPTTADPGLIPGGTRLHKWNETYIAYLYDREIPVYLASGANTLPEFSEEIAIPKPRGKQVKYERGEWWKYTKSHGWERA